MLCEPMSTSFHLLNHVVAICVLLIGTFIVTIRTADSSMFADSLSPTENLFQDILESDTSSVETLVRYESELNSLLQEVRDAIKRVAGDRQLLHERFVRDTFSTDGSLAEELLNATINGTVSSATVPISMNETMSPLVDRIRTLIPEIVANVSGNLTAAIVGGIKEINQTSLFNETTTHSTVKHTPMADRPEIVDETKKLPESTLSPLFEPLRNSRHSGLSDLLLNVTKCTQYTEEQLVKELKQQGTYNPDFMAWDVRGVLNFFEKATTDSYDKLKKGEDKSKIAEQNLAAIEALVKELNLKNCNLRAPDVLAKLYNFSVPRTSFDDDSDRLRTKRSKSPQASEISEAQTKYLFDLYNDNSYKDETPKQPTSPKRGDKKADAKEDIIGQVHIVPFGCRKRGTAEDGYLRLCGACQAIRRLPDNFFPPFINEVTCDEDKACLYFYDYPHGKCKQKHLNFVVLQNIGTSDCQLWRRFNLNVRVSCECFVDEMSFFAKYV